MDKEVYLIIKEYKQKLETLGINSKKIFLYGSHASGKGKEHSDLDMVVVLFKKGEGEMGRKIQFEWEVPDEVFTERLWKDEREAILEIKRSAILDLVRRQKISWRRGAELLDIRHLS